VLSDWADCPVGNVISVTENEISQHGAYSDSIIALVGFAPD
jgi:hypothetical protein